MELQDKVNKLITKQKDNGVSDQDIDKGLFLLFSVALKLSFDGLKLTENQQLLDKLNEGINKDPQKFLDNELMKEKRDLVVNEKGETLNQVFSRNFIQILDEFEQSEVSK